MVCPALSAESLVLTESVDFPGAVAGKIRNHKILTQFKVVCSFEEQHQCVKFCIFVLLSSSIYLVLDFQNVDIFVEYFPFAGPLLLKVSLFKD